ncbi:MAG: hypothetical protein UY31_C0039G0002 [Candidatus Wolfebacteria bacterium GW2011_GWE1_48_7]|uniref:Uncharacterized protein n=1 Tax=Candidatus Wolfebacteria bacterium GW2011_GWB1_47_1 TaxID=1619007 RepID=A0A0G4ATH4_9BACT|nr:MAG: hypothetical protein UX70_C0001G0747 [Candidatus Wolfebacteria bacterium GW2011_GWB1_47_1]KKU36790.1 MAG: hypothetical protein UX49_C0009G0035 [Candidatus Wolfebacteria bacterium GW2011_GWC2_46_275]KKU42330.1 MAG: hypothetical protein UX58_C0002G0044 [Candidatus Wolfebacteria bacterium GW2011_GWB2_46_69]KKU58909.1 MAG: hypothetical protein UX83_C0010G0031 [Candidatus Wolfebacteria bacterium GW2011_GWE2_47_12]KKU66127.1 MAG: hypothetical protein UX90_C0001G0186 [Candidatus Wolfebacteria 
MIVLAKQAPVLVLETAILADIESHRTRSATRGTLLLPVVRNNAPVPGAFRVAWEYRNDELTPTFLELMSGNILGDVAMLPKGTRVPYTLFMYSEVFHRSHQDQLQFGHTAYALIQKLTAARK